MALPSENSPRERTSMDELLDGLPRRQKKHKVHKRHRLIISTATIRSDINVTPLVDVVLVLLIIFMVVTPMITRGKPVVLPQTEHHDQKSDSGEQIVVSIACEGPHMGATEWECSGSSVWVSTEQATDANFVDKLQQEMRRGTGREIYVKADKRLKYGVVREVMQRINAAGAPTVALGSDDLKEKK